MNTYYAINEYGGKLLIQSESINQVRETLVGEWNIRQVRSDEERKRLEEICTISSDY
jgi:hypothetical protein